MSIFGVLNANPCTKFDVKSGLTLKKKIVEFANIADPDEVAHNEPPHRDLHCLLSSLCILSLSSCFFWQFKGQIWSKIQFVFCIKVLANSADSDQCGLLW